jgi:hypothetical protein
MEALFIFSSIIAIGRGLRAGEHHRQTGGRLKVTAKMRDTAWDQSSTIAVIQDDPRACESTGDGSWHLQPFIFFSAMKLLC